MIKISKTYIDLKGDVLTLDPKSKAIASGAMIIGVSLSIEPFSVLLFAILLIPIYILYRPNKRFIKKVIISIPFSLLTALIIILTLNGDVTLHIFYFERTYTQNQFLVLVLFRFSVSVFHTAIFFESELRVQETIESLTALKLSDSIIAILILISRFASKLQDNYQRHLTTAKTRGAKTKGIKGIILRLQILARMFTLIFNTSTNLSDTLIVRGFKGKFEPIIRDWTSEGLVVAILAVCHSIFFVAIPLMR